MYHNKKGRRLGRRPDHRKAMLRNLAISLIHEERIQTTVSRAKELRRMADRLVTYAKRGDLHGRRLIQETLGNHPKAAAKMMDEIAPRYQERNGGYTRVLKTGFRRGDAAPTALIEWVEEEVPERPKRKKRAKLTHSVAKEAESDEATETAGEEASVEEAAASQESEPSTETPAADTQEAAESQAEVQEAPDEQADEPEEAAASEPESEASDEQEEAAGEPEEASGASEAGDDSDDAEEPTDSDEEEK